MMKKYVVAVFPNSSHKGLKSSRDVVVEAENIFFAKEMVQGMYPDANVMVRREVSSSSLNSFNEQSSSSGETAALLGQLTGRFLKGYVSPHIQKILGTSEGVSGFIGVILLFALIVVGLGLFGLLGLFLPFIVFGMLKLISK